MHPYPDVLRCYDHRRMVSSWVKNGGHRAAGARSGSSGEANMAKAEMFELECGSANLPSYLTCIRGNGD